MKDNVNVIKKRNNLLTERCAQYYLCQPMLHNGDVLQYSKSLLINGDKVNIVIRCYILRQRKRSEGVQQEPVDGGG